MRKYLLQTAFALVAGILATMPAHAQDKQVTVLHWWTSGGEARALAVLKQKLTSEGYQWKDVPVAGGGGGAALTVLKAMVAAGNFPTASQMQGYGVIDYAQAGKLGDVTSVAKADNLAEYVPKPLQKFIVQDGKWVALPIDIHSGSWLWLNKKVFEKIGGTEPKNFQEFLALLDKAKAAGFVPLALGGQDWQEALLLENVVLSTGGPAFYKKAFVDLDDDALGSATMKQAFDNFGKLRNYVDSDYTGRDWNLATAMVIKGTALAQVMGDWVKGEFAESHDLAGQDFLCYRFPGTEGSVIYNSDIFGMFDVPADRREAQLALASAIMSDDVQSSFNVLKGASPARTNVPDTNFDSCGRKGIADIKAAEAAGTLVGSISQNFAAPPAIGAAFDDVATKFFHGQIKTSDEAVKQLVEAVDDAK